MESEHNQIAALLTDKNTVNDQFTYVVGKLDDKEIILRQCGIGKVNAAVGTAELIRTFHPDYVISTGVAGGIDSCLNVMDVVVSTKTVHHDFYIGMGCEYGQVQGMPTYFEADQRLVDAALALNNPTIHTGLICTGDQFISTQNEIDNIKHNFPEGLACDMESVAIAQTCYIYHVPFVSFRIISPFSHQIALAQHFSFLPISIINNSLFHQVNPLYRYCQSPISYSSIPYNVRVCPL